MPQILVIEFLHACPEAYAAASASMRAEGRQMLTAVVADFCRILDVSVTVVLCDSCIANLPLNPNATVLSVPDDVDEETFFQRIMQLCTSEFDFVLPIAPESDGTLSQLVNALESTGVKRVALPADSVVLCSDKWATIQFLNRLSVPTIPTCLISDLHQLTLQNDQLVVVKPRDGAGCDGIRRVLFRELLQRWDARSVHDSRFIEEAVSSRTEAWWKHVISEPAESASGFIVQEFTQADSLSIGIIGRGHNEPPLVLPLARQLVSWNESRPSYQGGEIPATIDSRIAGLAVEFAQQIAAELHLTDGYIGIDFLLADDGQHLLVTEINPRLCSSYIGYRMATQANLAEVLLHLVSTESVDWKDTSTVFNVADPHERKTGVA